MTFALFLSYEENVREEAFSEAIIKARDAEKKQRITLVGPHRDDLLFQINGEDIRKFGSQGQKRTAALSLKLAEIELVKEKIEDYPILLLDDVVTTGASIREATRVLCAAGVHSVTVGALARVW